MEAEDFTKVYQRTYTALLHNNIPYDLAVKGFDRLIDTNEKFAKTVTDYWKQTSDYIGMDIEKAAFFLAYGVIIKENINTQLMGKNEKTVEDSIKGAIIKRLREINKMIIAEANENLGPDYSPINSSINTLKQILKELNTNNYLYAYIYMEITQYKGKEIRQYELNWEDKIFPCGRYRKNKSMNKSKRIEIIY